MIYPGDINNCKETPNRGGFSVKKIKQIKANLEVLKKYLVILFISLFVVSCTTVKYVIIDPKDSTQLIEVRKRILYDDYHMVNPYPLYNNYWWYNSRPIIIQRPQPQPHRPNFGPLPPTPRPHR